MDFNMYQKSASETAVYTEECKVMYPAWTCGEAGEVANKVKKVFRDGLDNCKRTGIAILHQRLETFCGTGSISLRFGL